MFDVWSVFRLSDEQVDELPFGVIGLNKDGVVTQFNRFQSRLTRVSKERLLGHNLFAAEASRTGAEAFQERFAQFARGSGDGAISFDCVFALPFGRLHVNVTLLRAAAEDRFKILITPYEERNLNNGINAESLEPELNSA